MAAESLRAFYDLSREMVALERDRFEQAEEKSWRHFYILVALLGFVLVSAGRTTSRLLHEGPTGVEAMFVVAFGLFTAAAIMAGFVSIWNFRVALTLEPPIDRSVAEFARGSSIERFHLELGREFMRAAAENRRVADRKYRLLVWNFRFLILATTLGIVLGVLFYLLPDPS